MKRFLLNKTVLISISLFFIATFMPLDVYALTKESLAKNRYFAAYSSYDKLLKSRDSYKYRSNWLKCIEQFDLAYRTDISGKWASVSLYMRARVYMNLYKYSHKTADKNRGIAIFEKIKASFPKSLYAKKAEKELKKLSATSYKKKTVSSYASIRDIRYWSNPNYTRIVIDLDKKVGYKHDILPINKKAKKPERLYIDFINSRLANKLDKPVIINDNLLTSVRAAQFDSETVRVVVDSKSSISYHIFFLHDPFRTVIDIRSTDKKESEIGKNINKKIKGAFPSIARQLGLGVSTIAIDAGHGGKDYGAPGYYKGIHEKNIVLQIAKRLAEKIKDELGCKVVMTRDKDEFVALEERTAIANTKNADIFISIHTNASKNKKVSGIQTFFLNPAKNEESMLIAARENAASLKNISDLQTILNSLLQNSKVNESSRLAGYVQDSLYSHMKQKYGKIKNKGVNQALFYVLLGAEMPAILVETSFISNPVECKLLSSKDYQERLCDGIIKGIKRYLDELDNV